MALAPTLQIPPRLSPPSSDGEKPTTAGGGWNQEENPSPTATFLLPPPLKLFFLNFRQQSPSNRYLSSKQMEPLVSLLFDFFIFSGTNQVGSPLPCNPYVVCRPAQPQSPTFQLHLLPASDIEIGSFRLWFLPQRPRNLMRARKGTTPLVASAPVLHWN